jgi:drug/metabolite transporter (DMT)-like permease
MTSRNVSPALAFAIAALGIGLFSMMDAVMKSLVLGIGVYNALLWRQMISRSWRCGVEDREKRAAEQVGAEAAFRARAGDDSHGAAVLLGAGAAANGTGDFLTYISPILALLLGAATLDERVGRKAVLALVAALGGVLVVMLGQDRGVAGPEAFRGTLAVLGSAVLYAVNLVISRMQSQAPRPREIAFFQALVISTTLALAAPWLAVVPEPTQWPTLLLAAGLATASLWLLGWAYAHGDTGFLATTEYTSFVYAAVLGFLVFGERVSTSTVTGATIIVVAFLYTTRRRDIAETSIEMSA